MAVSSGRRSRTQPDQRTNTPKKLIQFEKIPVRREIKTTPLELSLIKDSEGASAAATMMVNELQFCVMMYWRTSFTKSSSLLFYYVNMPLLPQCLSNAARAINSTQKVWNRDFFNDACTKEGLSGVQLSGICVKTPLLKNKGPLEYLLSIDKLYISSLFPNRSSKMMHIQDITQT